MDWFVPAERPSVQTELLCFWNLGFIVLPSSVMWTIVQTTVDCMIKVTCTRHRAHLCRRLQADGFAHSLTTANISTKKKRKKESLPLLIPMSRNILHFVEVCCRIIRIWSAAAKYLSCFIFLWQIVIFFCSYWDIWRGPTVIYLRR